MNRPLLTALALGALGCGPTDTTDLTVLPGSGDHGAAKIYYGDTPDAPEHAATVGLHQLSGGSVYVQPFCSGTLITEDVVLTAAHCLDSANGGPKFKQMSAASLAIYVGDDPQSDILDHLYAVSEVEIYASYDRRRLTDDIGLVRLATPITESVSPVPHLTTAEGFTSSDAGMSVNFAGFGVDQFGNSGVKMQVDGTLAGLGCVVSGCPSGSDPATQVSYSQTGTTGGPCSGDSGGPMFVYRTSGTYVGGVTSYGDASCSYYGVSTRVDAFQSWIDSWIGGSGGTDGGASDGGGDGGGTDDCGDGVCGVGESCDGRSGTTACSTDCDGRTNGKPSLRYCEVEGSCEGPGCP